MDIKITVINHFTRKTIIDSVVTVPNDWSVVEANHKAFSEMHPDCYVNFVCEETRSYIYHILKTKQKQAVMQTTNRPSSYTKLSYIQKVSRVNRKLRTGDITKVAENTGFSPNYTSEVLSGKYFNDRIVNEAYDMTRGRIANPVKLSSLEA